MDATRFASSRVWIAAQLDGVAYAAHIGGFIAGLVLVKLFDQGDRVAPQQQWFGRGW